MATSTKKKRRNRKQLRNKPVRASYKGTDFDFEGAGGGEVKFIEGKEVDGQKPLPKLKLTAYTGVPVKVDGHKHPVIVNLAKARFTKDKFPIILDHETKSRLGHSTKYDISARRGDIQVEAVVSSVTKDAQEFKQDAANGFPFESSIGGKIVEGYVVEAGETAKVNGKVWDGPLIVSDVTAIREVSVTVFGADRNTSAKIAAKHSTTKGFAAMDFEEFVASLGLDPDDLTDEQRKKIKKQHKRLSQLEASHDEDDEEEEENRPPRQRKVKKTIKAKAKRRRVLAGHDEDEEEDSDVEAEENDDEDDFAARAADEEDRIDSIKAHFSEYEDDIGDDYKFKIDGKKVGFKQLKLHAIRSRWSPEKFELEAIRAARPNGQNSKFKGFRIEKTEIDSRALECSILRSCMVPEEEMNVRTGKKYGINTMFKAEEIEASMEKRHQIGGSIQALLELQIRSAGHYYSGLHRHGSEFVAAAVHAWEDVKASGFSTLNITNILENVMHKASLSGFQSVESVWPFIAAKKNLSDFKPHALYRLDYEGHFKKVAIDGELKHISMKDMKKSITAETYGAMLTIDRKTIKNDDLGLIVQQARGLGTLGGLRIEEAIFVLLLSNPGSFFSAGNGNLITGAGSALSITSLETARGAFRNQVVNGKPVGVSPRWMLVGTSLETTAGYLWAEGDMAVGGGNTGDLVFAKNPHKGLYRPYTSGYLNNTNITDQDGAAISGQSATQWYIGADPNAPQGAAIVIGFVDGRETPFFDEAETQFNIPGGLQFRSYFDFGVAMHIHQMMLKSAGA